MQVVKLNTEFDCFAVVDGRNVRVAQDLISGERFYKVSECLPEGEEPKFVAERKRILATDPVHVSSDKSGFTGYWAVLPEVTE